MYEKYNEMHLACQKNLDGVASPFGFGLTQLLWIVAPLQITTHHLLKNDND